MRKPDLSGGTMNNTSFSDFSSQDIQKDALFFHTRLWLLTFWFHQGHPGQSRTRWRPSCKCGLRMQPRGVSGGTRRSESNLHHPTFEHYRFTWRETLFFGYKKKQQQKKQTHYLIIVLVLENVWTHTKVRTSPPELDTYLMWLSFVADPEQTW